MDKFIMGNDLEVFLNLSISSEALVGTNVKLDKRIIKKSGVNSFKLNLGNSNSIENTKLNVAITCFVDENIDQIMNNSVVDFNLKDNTNFSSYNGQKLKIDDELFIIFFVVELSK